VDPIRLHPLPHYTNLNKIEEKCVTPVILKILGRPLYSYYDIKRARMKYAAPL
jgi:hypothetical protein